MTKAILIKTMISLILTITILTISIAGWLSKSGNKDNSITMGDVVVEIDAYFLYDDGTGIVRFQGNVFHVGQSSGQGSFTKTGVYKINLALINDPQYIKNLRVDVKIKSKVDTYFRIAAYEQLTLTYQSGGKTIEVATTQDAPMPFNYMDEAVGSNPYFYDNRNADGYFYYTSIVKRNVDETDKVVTFIADFGSTPINIYEERYSLQLGYIIEAVQAVSGPQINWGLPNRPWDDGAW